MKTHALYTLAAGLVLWAVSPALGQGIFAPQAEEPSKWAPPDEAARQKALKTVEDVFKDEIAAAKTPAQRRGLAAKLLAAAAEADAAAERWVLLSLARDMASQAGDLETALRAADATAESFKVEGLPLKVEALEAATRSGALADQQKALAEAAVSLAEEALVGDDFETASRLNRLGVAAARKVRDAALIGRAAAQTREVEKASRAFRKVQAALETLKTSPADPEANLAAGRYLCLVKGQWDKGTSMLALGSDAKLKTLAERELRGAADAAAQLALADGWWDLAEQEEGAARQRLQDHAADWYRRALPQLTGLDKTKAEKRIARPEAPVAPGERDYFSGETAKGIVFLHYGNHTWKNDGASLFTVTKVEDGHRVACRAGPGSRHSMVLFPKENLATRKLVADLTVEKGGLQLSLRPRDLAAAGTAVSLPAGARHRVELWVRNGVAQATLDGRPAEVEYNRPEYYGFFSFVTDGETSVVFHHLRFVEMRE